MNRNVLAFCLLVPVFEFGFLPTASGQEKFTTKDRINVHLGTGFGLYNVSNNQAGDKDAGALAGAFRLGADYGITPLISAGVALFSNQFATNKDSADAASIGGVGVYAHLNFSRRPKTTWYLHLGLGGSGFVYKNYNSNGKVSAQGGYIQAGVGFRRYFGEHFGLFSDFNLTGYNYDKFTLGNKEIFKTDSGNNFELGLSGLEFKIGLVVALGKNGSK